VEIATPSDRRRSGAQATLEHVCLPKEQSMIRKLASGHYRLYSRKVDAKTGKRRNLGTFDSQEAAQKHEREVQFFKRRG
jgi:hypothetical protein